MATISQGQAIRIFIEHGQPQKDKGQLDLKEFTNTHNYYTKTHTYNYRRTIMKGGGAILVLLYSLYFKRLNLIKTFVLIVYKQSKVLLYLCL